MKTVVVEVMPNTHAEGVKGFFRTFKVKVGQQLGIALRPVVLFPGCQDSFSVDINGENVPREGATMIVKENMNITIFPSATE